MYQYKFSSTYGLPIDIVVSPTVTSGYISFNDGEPVDWTTYTYDGTSLVKKPSDVFCYSSHGYAWSQVSPTYVPKDGEVIFASIPTEEQLKTSFPSIAASKRYTFSANAIHGDTLHFYDTTVTFGTDITIGDTIASTVANIVTYMKTQERLTGNYNVSSSNNTVTLSERFTGGGFVVPDVTVSGSIQVSSETLSESVWGYTTQAKHIRKLSLQSQADVLKEKYRNAYFSALADGDTATANANLGYARDLKTNLYNAMEAINDE